MRVDFFRASKVKLLGRDAMVWRFGKACGIRV